MSREADYILVGGGLQNGLLALLLTERQPHARITLVESEPQLGGSHTWCFHETDVLPAVRSIIEPLVVRTWTGYCVRFPRLQRHVPAPYAAVTSERLHRVLTDQAAARPNLQLMLGHEVTRIEPSLVQTATGDRWHAPVVVDARGPAHGTARSTIGYQKFLGLECEVEPHSNPREPMLMDANVEQTDGYRFFYVLPLQPDRVLIEDTYYSDTPTLRLGELRRAVADYAARRGIAITRVVREESGVLALPGRTNAPTRADRRHLLGGYAGGWFHPTTGYSLPLAARFARVIATSSIDQLETNLQRLSAETIRQQRYSVWLNRLLFDGFGPTARVPVFERFYRLPVSVISNFYGMRLNATDRVRLLCGRPPPGLDARRALRRLGDQRRERLMQGETP